MTLAVSPLQAGGPVEVTVASRSLAGGGRLLFADRLTHASTASLELALPAKVWRIGKR